MLGRGHIPGWAGGGDGRCRKASEVGLEEGAQGKPGRRAGVPGKGGPVGLWSLELPEAWALPCQPPNFRLGCGLAQPLGFPSGLCLL